MGILNKGEAMVKILMGAVLALGALAGCASSGGSSMPCEGCKFAVPDGKAQPPKHYCVVNGKQVDCRKSPAECPECAKAK
jgi:hypothetical protein